MPAAPNWASPNRPRLDPLCGAAALAACLRNAHRAYDKRTVLANCRVTGMGSTMKDLIDAARKMGMAAHSVTADEQGLRALPKPLIAHVENDHFIVVTHTDAKYVTYLCSDCGAWPGGEVKLTWAQWRALEANAYVAVVPKDSDWDKAITQATSKSVKPELLTVAMVGQHLPVSPQWMSHVASLAALIKSHVVVYYFTIANFCSFSLITLHCPCPVCCPFDGDGATYYVPNAFLGPSFGEPVNLATGEEEYRPSADLTVYNPVGPSVSWQRIYNHLRSNVNAASSGDPLGAGDYGSGWSQGYNIYVYDPSLTTANPVVALDRQATLNLTGSHATTLNTYTYYQAELDAPAGLPLAQPTNSTFWGGLLYTFTPTVGLSSSEIATNFEVRSSQGGAPASLYFDIIAAANSGYPAPMGAVATPGNGTVSLTWNAVPGASTYMVQQSTSPMGGTWTTVASAVPCARFTDSGLTNGTTYYYQITANAPSSYYSPPALVSATPASSAQSSNPQAPTGQISAFTMSGSDSPAQQNGQMPQWEIDNPTGTPIAWQIGTDRSNAHGWMVNANVVYPPQGATPATGYEARYSVQGKLGYTSTSGFFDVTTGAGGVNDANPTYQLAGSTMAAKYLIEPNGSRIQITPQGTTVPSSLSARTPCCPVKCVTINHE